MDKFVLNLIHRPEMVPEYSATVTGQGKEEDIGDKALLTIQMTYASLFNDEAVEIAKHDHEVYGDEIALSLLGLPCEEFREKYKTKDFCIWMFSMEDKKAIVNDVFEKFHDQKHIIPATTPGIPYLMEVHGHHGSHPDRTHMHRQQTRRRTVVL